MSISPRANARVGPAFRRIAIFPAVLLIRVYQWTLSPFIGRQCRFHPTCSNYAIEALGYHGFWKGLALTARRISRCHPFSKGGYDPVP